MLYRKSVKILIVDKTKLTIVVIHQIFTDFGKVDYMYIWFMGFQLRYYQLKCQKYAPLSPH